MNRARTITCSIAITVLFLFDSLSSSLNVMVLVAGDVYDILRFVTSTMSDDMQLKDARLNRDHIFANDTALPAFTRPNPYSGLNHTPIHDV